MKPWKEFLETNSIKEESVANVASGGHIAGLGDDLPDQPGSGEPGFNPTGDGRKTWWRKNEKRLRLAREKREERRVAKEKEFAEDIKNKTLKMAYGDYSDGYDTAKPMADLSNKKKSFKKSKT